ncbi:laminin subunit gamma-2 isoform X1 [Osmerus eperlanus]|uniref:laminin subunit gamma-2 isoform X1 n=1 Tax=Osmerus eperlanus TaxID=29151 RepID=UPI002E13C586
MKNISWISLCGMFLLTRSVQGTFRYQASVRCECNGKSTYCYIDTLGLHCVDCQENTEGRHCEKCKTGFYHQRAGESCVPCACSTTGSAGPNCDSRGQCSCKTGVMGDKCDQCPNGKPLTPAGCAQSSSQLIDDMVKPFPCFCYGHSSQCSVAQGYSVSTISSTFDNGPEGWRAATAQGVTRSQVQFRWSPKHQDIEVISEDIMPVYLYAPDTYLGNKLLSYGQNLSFSLRLDRGVRYPSTNDVVMEGSGLRVASSLGNLRTVVTCGLKITYTFRLDEQASSKWKPHLSPFQFQTLLQNLTAIKIRGTFGENGRGYLDNVRLVTARQAPGADPATWVQSCSCPSGYEGQFCESCAAGFKRRSLSEGLFSSCLPCSCRGGSCDPETGDCYSADETPNGRSCQSGYYSDPAQPQSCRKCPCPTGVTCSIRPGTVEVQCNRCPPGSTGPSCHTCEDGFYGDPLGQRGSQQPCQRCQCNGHIDPNAVGNCDAQTGECLRCLNQTRGFNCESCLEGHHHSQPTDACKPCACNSQRSLSNQCSDMGQCSCREGFEGLKCQRSACPSCFNPVKTKMERYTHKLQELETLFTGMETGTLPVNDAQMERTIRAAEKLVLDLQSKAANLTGTEKDLQAHLSDISRSHKTELRDIGAISKTVDDINLQEQKYREKVSNVQQLIKEIRLLLGEAKLTINSADLPQADAVSGVDILPTLVQKAHILADDHQSIAATVVRTANSALAESERGLALMRAAMNKENKINELISDLKSQYDLNSAKVKALEAQATRTSSAAGDESKMAIDTLKQIASLEQNLPDPLKKDIDAVVARLDGLKDQVQKNLTEYEVLQNEVQEDRAALEDLLVQKKAAQQDYDRLLARANAAKAETVFALNGFTDNMNKLDDTLTNLKGFDDQISKNKALADEAIKKLPSINATIQQAVGNNSETLFIIGSVSGDYDDAQGTVNNLEAVVSQLEEMSGSLPSYGDLVKDTTKLRADLKGLQKQAVDIEGKMVSETGNAQLQKDRAEEAAMKATGAYNNARQTKDAVDETLIIINNLLGVIGEPGSVDEERLAQLEDSIANARSQVNQQLRPRLKDLEEKEAAQRARLSSLDLDIDTILDNIRNLEDIRKTVPKGCYNSPPIERP